MDDGQARADDTLAPLRELYRVQRANGASKLQAMKALVDSGLSIVESKDIALQEEGIAVSVADYQAELFQELPEYSHNDEP